MSRRLVFETKLGRKRVVVLPKAVVEALGLSEGQRLRIVVEGDRIVIEPLRDAFWFAVHGSKIGEISFEELEEESRVEQEKLASGTA